jgi:hypothetical protein
VITLHKLVSWLAHDQIYLTMLSMFTQGAITNTNYDLIRAVNQAATSTLVGSIAADECLAAQHQSKFAHFDVLEFQFLVCIHSLVRRTSCAFARAAAALRPRMGSARAVTEAVLQVQVEARQARSSK